MLPRVHRISTDLGDFLLFATHDVISQALYYSGAWEPWNIQISLALLDGAEVPVVVDVGANVGAYAIPLARALAPHRGSVHAFEAQRIVYYQLCGNVVINRLDNCFPRHVAIGREECDLDLPVPDYTTEFNIGGFSLDAAIRARSSMTSISETGCTEKIRQTTLDACKLPRISLLKIDVEGMEQEVILGAAATLTASSFPPLVFESWSNNEAPWFKDKRAATLSSIGDLGYRYAVAGNVGIALHPEHPRQFDVVASSDGRINITRKK